MAGRAEQVYEQLRDASDILGLIGQPEDSYFDCKEWPTKDEDAQKMLAKAACGLTNADGGVIVIGMVAKSRPKDVPDVVDKAAPVGDTSLVKSRVLGLISNLVEPGIVGVEAREITEAPGAKSGFVIVLIPKADGPPHRSRKDARFYVRVGSNTVPMDYWLISDRFGVRPHAKLSVAIRVGEIERPPAMYGTMIRVLTFTVSNEGRGIARYPAILYTPSSFMYAPMLGEPHSTWNLGTPSEEWASFRGGVEKVIYPGESVPVATLRQHGVVIPGAPALSGRGPYQDAPLDFRSATIRTRVVCEGMSAIEKSFDIPAARYIPHQYPFELPDVTQ